jgi:hypothetical protein
MALTCSDALFQPTPVQGSTPCPNHLSIQPNQVPMRTLQRALFAQVTPADAMDPPPNPSLCRTGQRVWRERVCGRVLQVGHSAQGRAAQRDRVQGPHRLLDGHGDGHQERVVAQLGCPFYPYIGSRTRRRGLPRSSAMGGPTVVHANSRRRMRGARGVPWRAVFVRLAVQPWMYAHMAIGGVLEASRQQAYTRGLRAGHGSTTRQLANSCNRKKHRQQGAELHCLGPRPHGQGAAMCCNTHPL